MDIHSMIVNIAMIAYVVIEYWLGKTDKVKQGSVLELVLSVVLSIVKAVKDNFKENIKPSA